MQPSLFSNAPSTSAHAIFLFDDIISEFYGKKKKVGFFNFGTAAFKQLETFTFPKIICRLSWKDHSGERQAVDCLNE